MDADQTAITLFLKSWPGQFVSRKEICRRAGGKWRFREDENWAVPVLQRMLEDRVIEGDDTGHFRLMKYAPDDPRNKRKRVWLAPAYRAILRESGRQFGTLDLDKEPETAEQLASADPLLNYQPNPEFPRDNTPAQPMR
jgi:hypothetical protein